MSILEGKKVTKNFKGLAAVKDVDFFVREKEIAGLIGPNGAGKTTLFNVISGFYRPDSGEIKYLGKDIVGLKPYKMCKLGVARTFQITQPFSTMTTLENVMVGVLANRKDLSLSEAREEAEHILEFTGLAKEKDALSKNLTLPSRKRLELSRAIGTNPKLLLIDEVAAGLNPTEILEFNKLIRAIRDDKGISIFWIEHVMKAVMETSERIIVLHHGEKIAEGTPKEIANDKQVIEAYLGEKYA